MIKTFKINSHHTSVHNSHIITAIASRSIYISTIILYHHMSIKADDVLSSLYNMHVPIYTCTYIYILYRQNTNNLVFSLFTNIKKTRYPCTESSRQVQVSHFSF